MCFTDILLYCTYNARGTKGGIKIVARVKIEHLQVCLSLFDALESTQIPTSLLYNNWGIFKRSFLSIGWIIDHGTISCRMYLSKGG